MSMGTAAFADVTISVSQDSTYAGTAGEAGRTYEWYKVFSATPAEGFTGTTGGGYDNDGTPGAVTGDTTHAISYTASANVATKLGTWVAATGTPGQDGYVAAHWDKAEGNLWFDLSPIAGSSPQTYNVAWAEGVATDTDTVQAAAKWLLENGVYEAHNSETDVLTWNSDTKKWEATVGEGYYLLVSDTGNNLVAATTDISINEKNSYPPLDKTQADEDNTTQSDADRNVAVGDVLTYNVKVTVPNTVKVGDIIEV